MIAGRTERFGDGELEVTQQPYAFRRIESVPAYVFAEIERLKLELRRAGEDVIDLGFGNTDLPSPEVAVDKLCEAAPIARNHRYSASRGIPNLRRAICERYLQRYGAELDPEAEAIVTTGAKEGFCHLMWVLVEPGDDVLVPTPSYPIHRFAPAFAGAAVTRVPVTPAEELLAGIEEALAHGKPRPRVVVCSFPHNPTTATVDAAFMQRLVDLARKWEVLVVHDFAYADLGYDGHSPPSILQAEGANDVCVELYSLTKGFSMAGWRVGFLLGNAAVVQALSRLKSYLDYGTFQPIQIASITALTEAASFPETVNAIYQGRRDVLCDGLARIGWEVERPLGTMFVWARIPEAYRHLSSLEFALKLARVLCLAEEIALTHHEWWDGSDYPAGLRGEAIQLSGRIVALADVFDALTHPRPYEQAWTTGDAVAEIERPRGRQFDPAVVDAFRALDPLGLVGPIAPSQRAAA